MAAAAPLDGATARSASSATGSASAESLVGLFKFAMRSNSMSNFMSTPGSSSTFVALVGPGSITAVQSDSLPEELPSPSRSASRAINS